MKTYTSPERKLKKVLVEKRRRMRIDRALLQMKEMVLESLNVQQPEKYDKMEKADILDLTVRFLKRIRAEKQPVPAEGAEMPRPAAYPPYMPPGVHPMVAPTALRPMTSGHMVAHPIPVPAAFTMNMYPSAVRPQMPSAIKLEIPQEMSSFSPRIPLDMSTSRHPSMSRHATTPSATVTSSCVPSAAPSTSNDNQGIRRPTATCSCAPSTNQSQQDEDHVTSSTPSTSGHNEAQPEAGPSKPIEGAGRKRLCPSPQNIQNIAENIPAKLFRLERELIDGMWRPWNFA